MDINEVKKTLYKEKPIASLYYNGDHKYYSCDLTCGIKVIFKIPLKEGLTFDETENGQLLIRWIAAWDKTQEEYDADIKSHLNEAKSI